MKLINLKDYTKNEQLPALSLNLSIYFIDYNLQLLLKAFLSLFFIDRFFPCGIFAGGLNGFF